MSKVKDKKIEKKAETKVEAVATSTTPVVEKVVETKEVEMSETFKTNLKKSEEFQAIKKDIRLKMKEEKDKAKKSELEVKLNEVITEEKKWLKSIAVPLVEEKKDIYVYKVIKRGENAIIMEVTSKGYYGKEATIRGYDTIKRDIRRPQIYMGKAYDAAEVFPGDTSFAYWSYRFLPTTDALAKAEKKFNELETGVELVEEEAVVEAVVEIAGETKTEEATIEAGDLAKTPVLDKKAKKKAKV